MNGRRRRNEISSSREKEFDALRAGRKRTLSKAEKVASLRGSGRHARRASLALEKPQKTRKMKSRVSASFSSPFAPLLALPSHTSTSNKKGNAPLT